MSATRRLRRRGTQTEHGSFTGAAGELTVDLTLNVARVHDGVVPGGYQMLRNNWANLDPAVGTVTSNRLDFALSPTVNGQPFFTGDDVATPGANSYGRRLIVNAGGNTNVVAEMILFETGAVADDVTALRIHLDRSLQTAGDCYAIFTTATDPASGGGSAIAQGVGPGVAPLRQVRGTIIDPTVGLVGAVDTLADLIDRGVGTAVFSADGDTLTIGNPNLFDFLELVFTTPASVDLGWTFEYSTGASTWSTFTPHDGTFGGIQSGALFWDQADLTGWANGASGAKEIRITRTTDDVTTTPALALVQIVEGGLPPYGWDENGDINCRNLVASSVSNSAPLTPIRNETGTTYTPELSDAGYKIRQNNASPITTTIDPDSSVDFPVGTVLAFFQVGAGAITLTEGTGVTFNIESGFDPETRAPFTTIYAHKVVANNWDISGQMAETA